MRTLLVIGLIVIGLVTLTPVISAGDPPPGYGTCHFNEDGSVVWLENHDGTYYVVVDPSWRPIECYW